MLNIPQSSSSDRNYTNIEENVKEMNTTIKLNNNTIKEYENYLKNLLNIASESKVEYAPQIQMGLEKLKYLIEDNLTSKHMLLNEYKKTENLEKDLNELNINFETSKEELSKKSQEGKEIINCNLLLNNISTLTGEIDKYSEMNNKLISTIKMKENKEYYNKILEEINNKKKDNKKLYDIVNDIDLNKAFNIVKPQTNTIFSCMSNPIDNKYSLDFV